jgi:hypothetical protein
MLFPRFHKGRIIIPCTLAVVLLSGSYYLWDVDEAKFYPSAKRIDIYGAKDLFDEPPPKHLPAGYQFSSAYSQIARSGLWPLYRGEKPQKRAVVKSIWITPWSQVKTVDKKILASLWGIVINEVDEEVHAGFRAEIPTDDVAPMLRSWFNPFVQRRTWSTRENFHTLVRDGSSFLIADGILTDRHLGDWWPTMAISPYRQFMLRQWWDWLVDKREVDLYRYPAIGVMSSKKEWRVKLEDGEYRKVKMSVRDNPGAINTVYLGGGVWALYEKTLDGEFLLGGPELSDDTAKSGNTRWAAEALGGRGGRP